MAMAAFALPEKLTTHTASRTSSRMDRFLTEKRFAIAATIGVAAIQIIYFRVHDPRTWQMLLVRVAKRAE